MSDSVIAEATEAFASEVLTSPVAASSGVDAPAATSANGNKFYTEEDLARVRSQEKDKLYPQIDKLKEELDLIKKDREEQLTRIAKEEAAQVAAIEAETKRKQEEELEVRDLLKVKEVEWQEQLDRERQERERAFALLERERSFTEVTNYRNNRIEQERDNIIPELVDLINGDSVDEIESSIQGLKDRSSRILENVQQATQAARRDMTGTRVTTPPNAGPMDIETGNRQFTAEDIASMSLNDYAKYRSNLLSPNAQGNSKGLFG
jgi:DNA-binding transcriptional MerR regulator